MRIVAGTTVVLTGASGGLGTVMAKALAPYQVKLALVAFPGAGLDELRQSVESLGSKAITIVADLSEAEQRRQTLREVTKAFGPIDILINNAGVEFTSPYHELTEAQIGQVLAVNLEAPMLLTRLVLPEMLERKKGHIVNISSLAGKSGPALQEPYAATKAALIGLTSSLRASYRSAGVSASAIVPAFVEAGIYARLKARSGCAAPAMLTGCTAERVASAVIRAVERDLQEILVNRYPLRPILALMALSPAAGTWVANLFGVDDFFRRVFDAEKRGHA